MKPEYIKINFRKLDCSGTYVRQSNKNYITINPKRKLPKMIATFYHEYTHFLLNFLVRNNLILYSPNKKSVKVKQLEEKICYKLDKVAGDELLKELKDFYW